MTWTPRLTNVVVHLKDGRSIDVSGLLLDEAIGKLRALNLKTADIARTEHRISAPRTQQGAGR